MAAGIETLDFHLQPLDRGVHEARRDSGGGVFAKHMPGFQRVAQLQVHAAIGNGAVEWKAKLALGVKPVRREIVAGAAKFLQYAEKILPHTVLQHEPIVQRSAPAHQRAVLRLAPEPGDQGAQQQLLRQAYPRVRRHFKRAEFDQAQPSGRAVGGKQLVDADLGTMSFSGDIDQKIPKQAIDHPWTRWLALIWRWHRRKRDLELVKLVVACFVDTRSLAG